MNKLISLILALGTIVPTITSCNKIVIDTIPINTVNNKDYNSNTPVTNLASNTRIKRKNTTIPTSLNTLIGYSNNDSCGMFQVNKLSNDFITARHCIKKKFKADSPVNASTGRAVMLTKPTKGDAVIITKHFNQAVQVKVRVVEVNQCQAFFIIPKTSKKINSYIQSGDSGSPVLQNTGRKEAQVIGALSGGLVETRIRSVQSGRYAFKAGSLVYDDCSKFKKTVDYIR